MLVDVAGGGERLEGRESGLLLRGLPPRLLRFVLALDPDEEVGLGLAKTKNNYGIYLYTLD